MAGAVLLTGGNSFTGVWIAQALAAAGFEVVAPLLRAESDYDAERRARIERLQACAEVVFATPFATPAFEALVRRRTIVALAHHAADVTGYRDPDFDALAAFRRNTEGAAAALRAVADAGARAVVVTGTVFEAGEGGPTDEPLAVTPYGLSKTLTNVAFRHFAAAAKLRFGRFVIPSPYGVLEQQRSFPAYLFRSWFDGATPQVRTPLYIRDHLPAPRLGPAYADYLARLLDDAAAPVVARPSGWVASQGDFAAKVAREAAARLGRDWPLELAPQTALAEPLVRVNTDPLPAEWDEARFWDEYVGWYAAGR